MPGPYNTRHGEDNNDRGARLGKQGGCGENKRALAYILLEQMKGTVDPSIYRAYLAITFPDTGFTNLEDEEKLLEDTRKKEKERLK